MPKPSVTQEMGKGRVTYRARLCDGTSVGCFATRGVAWDSIRSLGIKIGYKPAFADEALSSGFKVYSGIIKASCCDWPPAS